MMIIRATKAVECAAWVLIAGAVGSLEINAVGLEKGLTWMAACALLAASARVARAAVRCR